MKHIVNTLKTIIKTTITKVQKWNLKSFCSAWIYKAKNILGYSNGEFFMTDKDIVAKPPKNVITN